MNYGQRFRYGNLTQMYSKFREMFRKRLKQKEEGTVQRHFGAAAREIEAERARKRAEAEKSECRAIPVCRLLEGSGPREEKSRATLRGVSRREGAGGRRYRAPDHGRLPEICPAKNRPAQKTTGRARSRVRRLRRRQSRAAQGAREILKIKFPRLWIPNRKASKASQELISRSGRDNCLCWRLCGGTSGIRFRQRSHHVLQVKSFFANSQVVIAEHQDNHQQRPRDGSADHAGDGQAKNHPDSEAAP